MSPGRASDVASDPGVAPRPSSPIESLPLELLSRITLLALDPTDNTKHSPENSTTLRSLALVSRAWYHSAVRELVASPRFTAATQLKVYLDLVQRLGCGNRVKEIIIDGGNVPRQKTVTDLDAASLVGVDREALEKQYHEEWRSAARPRWKYDLAYADPIKRLAVICPRITALRLVGMVLPETVLYQVESLPLEAVWIESSYLYKKPFLHLPATLQALHLTDVPMLPSKSKLALARHPTFNGSVFDTITSLVLDTNTGTFLALAFEYFPEVTNLELLDTEGPPALPNHALAAFRQLGRLPKLKVFTLPDTESWREAWKNMLDLGERHGEGLKVIWKPVA